MNDTLNEKQTEAVTASFGPVAVIAGAGTGKTHVLTNRFIYVVKEFGLKPERILTMTFTNKAALEMKSRITKNINHYHIEYICTFHSLCVKILRHDIDKLKRNDNFNVIDEEEQTALLKEIYKEKELNPKDISYKKMLYLIDIWKQEELDGNDLNEVLNNNTHYGFNTVEVLRFAYEIYLSYLQKCIHLNLLDFNDLLILAHKLLKNYDEVRSFWRSQFDYVMVDESQDINQLQYEIFALLINDNADFFIVGDPDQTIYTWRGANESLLREIKKQFPNIQIIILERNYRSTSKILKAANLVISENPNRFKKDLYTTNDDGKKLVLASMVDEYEEGSFVAKKIEELIKKENASPKDICILYRSKHLSRNIEQALIERNIAYKVIGGYKFYQRKEIKDLIAYLKVINNEDELSLKRIANVPRRKISSETLSKLDQYAFQNKWSLYEAFKNVQEIEELSSNAKQACLNFYNLIEQFKQYKTNHNLVQLLKKVYQDSGYEEYLKNEDNDIKLDYVQELIQAMDFYISTHDEKEITLNKYLQDIALFTSMEEEVGTKKNEVLLMTVHQAKGLEWKYVFLTNFTDDNFPSLKAQEEEHGIEEERRIAYVALTRAKNELYITLNTGYSARTNTQRIPSRFMNAIMPYSELYEYAKENIIDLNKKADVEWYDSKNRIDAKNMYHNEQVYEYKVGDKIVHTIFGEGKVLEVTKNSLKIMFNNSKTKGIKVLDKQHKAIKRIIN